MTVSSNSSLKLCLCLPLPGVHKWNTPEKIAKTYKIWNLYLADILVWLFVVEKSNDLFCADTSETTPPWQLLLLLIWIFGKFELKPDYSVQQVDGGDSSKSLCWFLWYPRRKKTKSEPADVQYLLKLPTTQKTLYVKRYLFNSREPRKSFETHWIEKVSIDFCDPSQKKRKFEPDDVQNL